MTTTTTSSAAGVATKLMIAHLRVAYERNGESLPVLDDLSLEVGEGEFLCVLGPSGCGKSTLLNVMAGFLKPATGMISIDGETVTEPDPRRIFVFQERGVFPWLTVAGNVGFGLHKLARAAREERVMRYIGLVGLEGFEHSYPSELSGGMKQRLEVARALAVQPDMLFLDEPFSALDSITRLTLRKELLRIWQTERKTIVLVTHDIDEAVQLADRIVLLTARPAKVEAIVDVDLTHPRDALSRPYLELRARIGDLLGVAEQV